MRDHSQLRAKVEPLQRAIVDFGAKAIEGSPKAAAQIPERSGVGQLISEIDERMIPVVKTANPNGSRPKVDRRTTRPE